MENNTMPVQSGRSFEEIMQDVSQNALSIQKPVDYLMLLGYSVNLFAAIRICIEAGAFRFLAASNGPVNVKDIDSISKDSAQEDSGERLLERAEYLGRMLRAAAGLQLLDETEPGVFQANELTRLLAEPGFDLGYRFLIDTALEPQSTLHHMTTRAKASGWTAPAHSTVGPYQQARGIAGMSAFDHWIQHQPHHLTNLSALMKILQRDRLHWTSWFPADVLFEGIGNQNEDRVFLADVGGGLGHDLMGLAMQYPDRRIKLMLQDLPSVIAQAREEKLDARIEMMEHDFFKPNPLKNARIYYIHKISHDWPDGELTQILGHLRDAMAPDSRIFINDFIVPDVGAPLLYSASDMTLECICSAQERSESMFRRLIGNINGLEVRHFYQAPELKGEGIVEISKTT